jgi:hypothetical protein
MLSHTARARPVLLFSPLPSRQNQRKENGYRYGYKYGYKFGRFHVQSPTNSIAPKAIAAGEAKDPFGDTALSLTRVTR